MRDQLFHLPPDAGGSLQGQLREMLVRAILDGHIPPGDPVPSCRGLARQLGVARNTVVLAYQHLVDEGYLVSRERSGYFVAEDVLAGRAAPAPETPPETPAVRATDWGARLRMTPSTQRNVERPIDWPTLPYPFLYGQMDPALFPIADWRECVRQASSVRAIREWTRDRIDSDDPQLIEQIHTRVLPRRGVWADADQILVTVGAQHALYLLSALLFSRHTVVGIEDPGYPDARNLFSLCCGEVLGIEVDGDGLVTGDAIARCDYVYCTPSHQYPTTVTLPLERRHRLLEQARRDDIVIIEDDYESELSYVGEPTPALRSLDSGDRVIYIGSLSKSLAPGLRLGYMVGPPELIREARALRRLELRHPPANNQRAVALFLALGHHDSLVRRLSHTFRDRWKVTGEALARHMPDSARVPAFGGTAYWVRGPASLDARELGRAALDEGILIEPGDLYFLDPGNAPRNFFRLGFSSLPSNRIEAGVQRLAALVDRLSR